MRSTSSSASPVLPVSMSLWISSPRSPASLACVWALAMSELLILRVIVSLVVLTQ